MPITIISGNLNQYGNAGQFETDRSTWGFADSESTVARSSAQQALGLYSALVVKSNLSNSLLIPCRYASVLGKKYLIKAKVRVPTATPLAGDSDDITFNVSLDNLIISGTVLANTNKTVLEAKDTWVDVDIQVEHTNTLFPTINEVVYLRIDGAAILNGQIFVDRLEVYEFTGDSGTPPPAGIVQFANNSFASELAPWENLHPSSNQPFVWDSGNSALADGISASKSKTKYLGGITNDAGPWPPGDYVVEIVAENLSEGGLPQHNELVRLAGFQSTVAAATIIPHTLNDVFDRVVGDQTRIVTFTLDQFWLYLGFTFEQNGLGVGSKINFNVKSITVIDGPVPSEIEDPVVSNEVFLSKNPITLGMGASAGWEALTNYRLWSDVRVEDEADGNVYVSKLKVELPPDVTGNVVFWLNEAFRDCFKLIPPAFNTSTIIRLTDRIKRFKNYTGELQNTEVTPPVITAGDPNLVIYGGIDKFHYPVLNYLSAYLPTHKKFLTWAPLEKYVDRVQEDYLNFWIYADTITSLKIRIKAYFDDTTDETNTVSTLDGVLFQGLYQIPAGPNNCGVLLIDPAKNVIKYELTLLDQDDEVISEVRTFHIIQTPHPLTRYFMFSNSFGAFEVLRFTGAADEVTEFSRDLVMKFLPHDYTAADGEFVVNSVTMMQRNSYSSGYIKNKKAAEWHEYMKDFLISTRIFDVTTGQRLPVVIASSSHSKEDQNYNRFIRFDAKPAYDNESFTPSSI